MGAVFRNLKMKWPGAHLASLVEPAYASILELNPDVDETFALPASAGAWLPFVRRLRRARFTHVFDLDNNDRTALIARLTGAPFRAALWHEGHHARWRSLYTHDVRDPAEIHERRSIVDYYLAILAAADVPNATREIRLIPRPADVAAAQKFAPSGGRRLLVHPGSRSAWRIWPA